MKTKMKIWEAGGVVYVRTGGGICWPGIRIGTEFRSKRSTTSVVVVVGCEGEKIKIKPRRGGHTREVKFDSFRSGYKPTDETLLAEWGTSERAPVGICAQRKEAKQARLRATETSTFSPDAPMLKLLTSIDESLKALLVAWR